MQRAAAVLVPASTVIAATLLGCAQQPLAGPVTPLAMDAHVHSGGVHVLEETPGSCPVCEVYERRRDSVVRVRTMDGLGTGVVIDGAGTVLTNAHVVGDEKIVAIETYYQTVVRGTVERVDKGVDLALVRLDAPDVKWTGITPDRSESPTVGSKVFVIGHPAGLGWTVTEGILSAKRRMGELRAGELLQITAAVSPGNSGGPVFDAQGVWIGTVVSKLVATGVEGISFVIPAGDVRAFLAGK